jgi:hypothetical protein
MSKGSEGRSLVITMTAAAFATGVGLAGAFDMSGDPKLPKIQAGVTGHATLPETNAPDVPDLAARVERLRAIMETRSNEPGFNIAQFSNRWCNERCRKKDK